MFACVPLLTQVLFAQPKTQSNAKSKLLHPTCLKVAQTVVIQLTTLFLLKVSLLAGLLISLVHGLLNLN
jgi:hypothetical protein